METDWNEGHHWNLIKSCWMRRLRGLEPSEQICVVTEIPNRHWKRTWQDDSMERKCKREIPSMLKIDSQGKETIEKRYKHEIPVVVKIDSEGKE